MGKKINILFSSFPDYSGNPKALYEYINSNYPNKFNLFWVFYSSENLPDTNLNQSINFVSFGSPEYLDLLKKIDVIFDTNGALLKEKKKKQVYVNLWHGASPKKKGYLLDVENFAPQDEDYYDWMHQSTDYVVVPSEFSRMVFSSAFDINYQRVVSLGYCRDDYLFNSNGKQILSDLTGINLFSYNKILCYLPTFRVGCNRSDSYNFWENNLLDLDRYNENDLFNYLEKNNYLLIIKKHPSEESKIPVQNCKNILILEENLLLKNSLTIYEILNCIDLLIADYSSVYVEYSLLNRPLLFLHKNLEEYKNNRGIILNDINFWSPGPQVSSFENFKIELDKLLNDKNYFSAERNSFKKLMFDNNISNICKKTFEFFFDSSNFSLKVSPFNSSERLLKAKFNALSKEHSSLKEDFYVLNEKNSSLLEENNMLKEKIEIIYNSRSFKIFNKVQHLKNSLKKGKK